MRPALLGVVALVLAACGADAGVSGNDSSAPSSGTSTTTSCVVIGSATSGPMPSWTVPCGKPYSTSPTLATGTYRLCLSLSLDACADFTVT